MQLNEKWISTVLVLTKTSSLKQISLNYKPWILHTPQEGKHLHVCSGRRSFGKTDVVSRKKYSAYMFYTSILYLEKFHKICHEYKVKLF